MADVLTDIDREALRRYGAGADLGDIALDLSVPRERLGLRMAHLCNLNRNRAKELTRDMPAPHRPIRGRRPEPDPAELDRVDQVFAEVFARKSPQIAFVVDAARALSKACDRELYPGCPMEHEIRGVDLAVAALDGVQHVEREAKRSTPDGPPLERWSAHRCAHCRYLGPADDHRATVDRLVCDGHVEQLQPVTLLVVPRDQPCQP